MSLDPHWLATVLQIIVIAPPAIALAWVLRLAGVPGGRPAAALIAGMSVGLLAGPGVLGRAAPTFHARAFSGGQSEREELRELEQRRAQEIAALKASGVSHAAVDEYRASDDPEAAPLLAELRRAEREALDRLLLAAQSALAAALLALGPSLMPAGNAACRAKLASMLRVGPRCVLAGGLACGLTALSPALLWAVVEPGSARAAISWGLILAAPGIAGTMRGGPYIAAGSGLALCVAAALVLGWSVGMTLAGVGLMLGMMLGVSTGERRGARRIRSVGARIAMSALLPLAMGLLAASVDLSRVSGPGSERAFWMALVVAALWSSDGRWFCGWLAWKLTGPGPARQAAWRSATDLMNSGAGIAQAALCLLLLASAQATPEMVPGVLLGAAIIECSRRARTWLSMRLDARAAQTPV